MQRATSRISCLGPLCLYFGWYIGRHLLLDLNGNHTASFSTEHEAKLLTKCWNGHPEFMLLVPSNDYVWGCVLCWFAIAFPIKHYLVLNICMICAYMVLYLNEPLLLLFITGLPLTIPPPTVILMEHFRLSRVNSSPPGQNGRHFAYDIFRSIFVNKKFCILIKISLKFVPKGPIDNNPENQKIRKRLFNNITIECMDLASYCDIYI